jgi:hypothetical protein
MANGRLVDVSERLKSKPAMLQQITAILATSESVLLLGGRDTNLTRVKTARATLTGSLEAIRSTFAGEVDAIAEVLNRKIYLDKVYEDIIFCVAVLCIYAWETAYISFIYRLAAEYSLLAKIKMPKVP